MARIGLDKNNSYRSRYHTDVGRQTDGSANASSGESFRWDMNHLLNYTRSFGKHNLELMGGFVTLTSHNWGNSAQRQGFPTDSIPHVYLETRDVGTIPVKYNGNSSDVKYAKYSYIGRLNYNFAGRYYVQFNIRADGSSRFGKNNRWGTFPSASIAWRLSEEPFMDNVNFLRNLKLRATYGVTGNDAFANFLHTSTYTAGANYPIWGTDEIAVGYSPSAIANPDLRWEEVTEKAVGLDLGLWKGRIDMVLNGFIKDSKDLLYYANIPAHTGFSQAWVNIGKVRVTGFELQLTTRNVSKKDFSWRSTLTFSHDRNEVLSLGQIEAPQFSGRDQESVVKKGLPINAMWGWIMEGIFQNQEGIDAQASTLPDGTVVPYQNENTAPGDIRFANTNGFEVDSIGNVILDREGNPVVRVDDNDRTDIGKPNPDFHFGLDNTFRYKNLEFSFFFQGMYGNDILSLTRREIERMDHYFNFSSVVANRWQYEGQDTDVPRSSISDPNRNNSISTRWLEDGSFLRLKYVTLAYKLPENLLSPAGIRHARIFVTAENLLTFTRYSLYDPEIATNSSRGIDMGGYPQARTITFGINLGF
jgi:TonB-linked SusC/RagA family outer membrane protein